MRDIPGMFDIPGMLAIASVLLGAAAFARVRRS
jgi:hypothetical protein